MSRVSSFSFTNTTANTHDVTPIALSMVSNYGSWDGEGDKRTQNLAKENTVMTNRTASTDAPELISYSSKNIPSVNTSMTNLYPPPVNTGVQYRVVVEDMLTTTETTDPTFRVDEPIVAQLIIRHPKSSNITSTQVEAVFKRLVGAVMKNDGTFRFDDLMRGCEEPVEN
jgi:hypothetical protein